jgi:chromosome segregation and condensation protein ScpB
MIHPNSMAAYISLRDSGELSKRELEVLEALQKFGPMTRDGISIRSGMRLSGVCGRVNKLVERNLVEPCGTLKNPETGKPNEVVRLVLRASAPQQMELAGVA